MLLTRGNLMQSSMCCKYIIKYTNHLLAQRANSRTGNWLTAGPTGLAVGSKNTLTAGPNGLTAGNDYVLVR